MENCQRQQRIESDTACVPIGNAVGCDSIGPGRLTIAGRESSGACGHHGGGTKYLTSAAEPLASVATVLVDTGLRPEECFKLRWEHISFNSGRHGALRVMQGKTAAARRMLPLTLRVRTILDARWENAGEPEEGWIWPAPTRSGHVEYDSIRIQ